MEWGITWNLKLKFWMEFIAYFLRIIWHLAGFLQGVRTTVWWGDMGRISRTIRLSSCRSHAIFLHTIWNKNIKRQTRLRICVLMYIMNNTTSWGCWKHPFVIPGVTPMFLKPKLHKESKNGFKTINYRPPLLVIFSKNCFQHKNHQKIWTFCWFFNFDGNILDHF